ncbi:MAG: thiamine diphosphokinase [Oscillospiraceae bacterium]|nr:thiamine diphosphokinase [Oscillospiraceae bacterium]
MKRCVIISNGITDLARFNFLPDDYIICADGGIRYAEKFGIKPSLVVGDFDSTDLSKVDFQTIRYPKEKDVTDTMIAISCGIEQNCTEFVFLCSLGGRLDHTIANIQNLAELSQKGINAYIFDEKNIAFVLCGECEQKIKRKDGFKLSIFALTNECKGVTLNGVKYPLSDYTLSSLIPLGISNEFENDFATIKLKEGRLLVILSHD